MHYKWIGGVAAVVVAISFATFLVGFGGKAAPQPQRVSDLVARLDALEEENRLQQDMLDELSERLDALEASRGADGAIRLDDDVSIPQRWSEDESSDGIIRYHHDPDWELATDEPGAIDLWLDEETAIYLTWDWAYDLLNELHDDKDFLRFFEEDLVRSDDTLQMHTERSGEIELMGETAHYWEISVEAAGGYTWRMLSLFYPCSDRTSCNVTFARYDPDPDDGESVAEFTHTDWEFLNTFAQGIEFQTDGESTMTANANLRACPDISCEIVGKLVRGEIVNLAAVSEDGFWFQLASGEWVAAALVYDAPLDLPVVQKDEDI